MGENMENETIDIDDFEFIIVSEYAFTKHSIIYILPLLYTQVKYGW